MRFMKKHLVYIHERKINQAEGALFYKIWLIVKYIYIIYKDIYHCYLCEKATVHFVNTLRPGQDDRHIAGYILKCILLNEN